MVRLVLKGSNKTYDSLHTDYKVEDYAFTILANTFKDRTKQEWDKKYLLSFGLVTGAGNLTNAGDNVGDVSETKLSERQRKILNLIKESPTITGKQMSEILSVSQRTIERDLSAMQKMGIIKNEGKDNAGVWVVDG